MNTYNFICDHLEVLFPDAIPVMDEYLISWLKEDGDVVNRPQEDVVNQSQEDVTLSPEHESDLSSVIYPYLAAYKALTEAGVADAEKYILELRTEEVGS